MKRVFLLAIGSVVSAGALLAGGLILAGDHSARRAGLFDHTDRSAVARGAALYAGSCAACHGATLEGQPDWRTPLANGRLPAPPHDATGHTWHHPDAQLFEIVKYGTAAIVGNGYESDMPGYGDSMTDQQIKDVMAYIKSTWPRHIIARHDEMNARFAVSQ
jgi:mono/diheme cytochrome c family protein